MSQNEMEEEEGETRLTQYAEEKEIVGSHSIVNILGKAGRITIRGGKHTIKVNSNVENIELQGGSIELQIKAHVKNLKIYGGKSEIYVHNYNNAKVNKFYIMGGNHKIWIYSFVDDLEIHGGIINIKCNFENSRLNKLNSIGGTREIFLNPNTNKCEKVHEAGTFNLHHTEIIKEPELYQISLEDGDIFPIEYKSPKPEDKCLICLSNYNKNNMVYFLPCTHHFHAECILKWFSGKVEKFCPTCKFQVKNRLIK